jgi:hypothetical protein
MMCKNILFGFATILIILTVNMATNDDGEMLFHFADSNLTYTTTSVYILHILPLHTYPYN